MKDVARKALAVTLGSAVIVLAFLAILSHPNDARMNFPKDLATKQFMKFFERRASLLGDNLSHELSLSHEEFAERRQKLIKSLPEYTIRSSARFVSPYQIYVPVGSYPLRLDAQDGVFIPSGATLTIDPRIDGEFEMRFVAFSPSQEAQLHFGVAATLQTLRLLAAPDPTFDANAPNYKNYWRFLSVDPEERLATWEEARSKVKLASGERVQFRCDGGEFGCVLGDVVFYAATEKPRPNVLVILVDTLRSDALHAGNAPRMEQVAKDGVDFARALAAGNMTSPSTNAFLSCLRPSQLGQLAFAYNVGSDYREAFYQKKHRGFPERFLRDGYDTAMIGNVSVISEIYGVGISHGFKRQISLETDGYDTPMIAREALRWLERNGDHPFLLYLHFNGPHAPYRAPFRDLLRTFPGAKNLGSYAEILRWLYQSEVAYTDRYLGEVIDGLSRLGLDKNTTIVLTADHGDQHKDRVYSGNYAAPDFQGAYFDHGATLYNDEIQVPLVVKGPKILPGRVDDYVSTLDVAPTLLKWLSIKEGDAGCAGVSLASYFTAERKPSTAEHIITSEGFKARAVLLMGRYKYIRTYEPTDKRVYSAGAWSGEMRQFMVPEQLFDLGIDPDEKTDLLESEPELLQKARQTYRETFGIKDSYELVVESPTKAPFSVTLPAATNVRFEEGDGKVTTANSEVRVQGGSRERTLLEIRSPLATPPVVSIDGQPVPLLATSMKLNVAVSPKDLPVETGGRYTLLAAGKSAAAYLRKVEDDGQTNRRISVGNAAFEKVLREWGYLNDK